MPMARPVSAVNAVSVSSSMPASRLIAATVLTPYSSAVSTTACRIASPSPGRTIHPEESSQVVAKAAMVWIAGPPVTGQGCARAGISFSTSTSGVAGRNRWASAVTTVTMSVGGCSMSEVIRLWICRTRSRVTPKLSPSASRVSPPITRRANTWGRRSSSPSASAAAPRAARTAVAAGAASSGCWDSSSAAARM